MTRGITIHTIADKAGVSYQTVSRVINNRGGVSEETRQRVEQVISEFKFQPNRAARNLSNQATQMIGMVVPYGPDFLSSDPHLLNIVHGIDKEATLRNYSLLVSTSPAGGSPLSACERLLRERLVDGVIFEGGMGEEGALLLKEKGYPVVMTGYNRVGIPSAHSDDEGGSYLICQHLIALGHTRVGIISGPEEGGMSRMAHLRGCEKAFVHAGKAFDSGLAYSSDFTSQGGYQAAESLLQRTNPPTALYVFSDRMAIGALRWLREHGYQVPKDVSVAGYDDGPFSEWSDPALTTVHQYSLTVGQMAAQMLFDLMRNDGKEVDDQVIPVRLVVRQSTSTVIG